ncbi:alr0857 family protein [Gloeobacter morelensis]|uniref:YCII-related domain-containing protein n=1 Tax=Gloeobacter morelensis MG652769 TaxID=2781736 RepID=A0ABY3PJ02_9CYAN|nr:alr0857 family protein [Gloeobacter morelensis]UFP93646.1 hypothetical protein ISF26_17925 [Gloeobacter morelensis MG652769]
MLKLMYTEAGIYIEAVELSVERFVGERGAFAASVGINLIAEPGWASVLVADLPGAASLTGQPGIALCRAEEGFVEVSVIGVWLASAPTSEEGVFAAELPPECEARLLALWKHGCRAELSLTD